MIHLTITVANTAELLNSSAYGAGALLRWESGPTATGAFVEGGTVPLVSGTVLYDIWDSAGVAGTWYRTRISNAGNTVDSAYSTAFEGGSAARYAELDDLLPLFETAITSEVRQARLEKLLDVATAQIIDECDGRDYFRHPFSGTATWTSDGNGSDVLHIHEGVISLSTLELSYDGGLHYVSVTATDYMLLGDNPYSQEPIPASEPYFHIRFTGYGGYRYFPVTVRAARLTGVRGWPAIPTSLVEATAQRARQLAAASATYAGSDAGGPDGYGPAPTTDRFWPQSLWNFLKHERGRFRPCVLGGSSGESAWVRR